MTTGSLICYFAEEYVVRSLVLLSDNHGGKCGTTTGSLVCYFAEEYVVCSLVLLSDISLWQM